MSDPTTTTTAHVAPPAPTSTASTASAVLHDAADWLKRQADGIVTAANSIHLSKPAVTIAKATEAALEEAGLVALEAGERTLLTALLPSEAAAVDVLFGAVAPLVKEFLARIPAR